MADRTCHKTVQREAPYHGKQPKAKTKPKEFKIEDAPLSPPSHELEQVLKDFMSTKIQKRETFHWISCGLDINAQPIGPVENVGLEWKDASESNDQLEPQFQFVYFDYTHPSTLPDPENGNFACVSGGRAKTWQEVVTAYSKLATNLKPYFSATSHWRVIWKRNDAFGQRISSFTVTHHSDKTWPNYDTRAVNVKSKFE